MGWSAQQVNASTLWDFAAASAGYRAANSEEKAPVMSDERAAELGIEGF